VPDTNDTTLTARHTALGVHAQAEVGAASCRAQPVPARSSWPHHRAQWSSSGSKVAPLEKQI